MSGTALGSLDINLKTLFSRVSLVGWFITIFCFCIYSFPETLLSLISCNFFWFCNRLRIFSTISKWLLIVSTCLLVFSTSFYLFTIYQFFLLVLRVVLLVLTRLPVVSTRLLVVSHFAAYTKTISNLQHK